VYFTNIAGLHNGNNKILYLNYYYYIYKKNINIQVDNHQPMAHTLKAHRKKHVFINIYTYSLYYEKRVSLDYFYVIRVKYICHKIVEIYYSRHKIYIK